MYSMVLMVALSHGAATPAFHADRGIDANQPRYGNFLHTEQYRHRRGGCCGCCGGCYGGSSCYGGGWSCCGCYGGGYSSGWGCCGGYSSGWGCCGGGMVSYGCTGGIVSYGCTGGAGYGAPMMSGPQPAGPGGAGGPERMPAPRGPSRYQYEYGSGFGEPGQQDFGQPLQGQPLQGQPQNQGGREQLRPPQQSGPQTRIDMPATFTVRLPADAKLTVDGHLTSSVSAQRTFRTPPLPQGEAFTYNLKAELTQNGKAVNVSKQITVRGGENTEVSFQFPENRLTRK